MTFQGTRNYNGSECTYRNRKPFSREKPLTVPSSVKTGFLSQVMGLPSHRGGEIGLIFSWRRSSQSTPSEQHAPAFDHLLKMARHGDSEAISSLYRHAPGRRVCLPGGPRP